jgi:hypothetical protein
VDTNDEACLYTPWHAFNKVAVCSLWSVLAFFQKLTKQKKIPKKVANQLPVSAFAPSRSPQPTAPMRIVKTRVLGPSQEFLVENAGGDLTWVPSGSSTTESLAFARLLSDWKRARTPVEAKHGEDKWMEVCSYRLLQRDAAALNKGGPLNQAVMDAAMAKLAMLSGKFKMNSCLCPLEGYARVNLNGEHFQVHHCGTYNHWVFSIYRSRVIWYGDYLGGSTIPPSVVVELLDLYSQPDSDSDTEIRVLRLPLQKLPSICGVLALLSIAFVGNDAAGSPDELCSFLFDESEGGKWVHGLLEGRMSVSLPGKMTSKPLKLYDVVRISPELVARISASLMRGAPVLQPPPVLGHGNQESGLNGPEADYRTADAQAARLRLVTGCVIQTETLLHAVGNWLIDTVTPELLTAVPFNPPISLEHQPSATPTLVLDSKSPTRFLVCGPPPMRSLRFASWKEYETSQAKKLMLVYPVRQGRLSNTAFMSPQANSYFVVEAVPCRSRFDVECLMRTMAGRSELAGVVLF